MTRRSGTPLESALNRLRSALSLVRLPLPLPGAEEQQAVVRELADQLDDYVLPRLATIDAPLLAVVGGSTGAGKSTLVNSLVGRLVSAPGVIRPTTRAPVLVHHSSDARWFADDRILPGLARSSGSPGDARSLQLVVDDSIPPGLAILDAPDIDSVVQENRQLAAQLLAAADLWLFVTSAARYADAVPWDFLLSAAERSAAVAVVLDRVPPGAMADVPPHLGQLMSERGLAESPLFAVPETTVDEEGLLPASAIQPVRGWLAALVADQASRAAVVYRTLDGAIGALSVRTPRVARAVDEQLEVIDQLRADVDHAYAEAVRAVQVQTADGTLLRGEVLARWHEFVGTGEFFRALEQKVSWLRDRVVATIRGEPPGASNLKVAVESGLESLLRQEADAAAERAEGSWQAHAAGRQIAEGSSIDLSRYSPDFPASAARAIRDWQGAVLDLVADEGMSKRSKARFLALGVNGVGVALMIVVFAHTGGLVGAEVGVAGGTAVLAQRLLEAVFGDQAIRRLAQTAKDDLDARVETLMADELVRYHRILDDLGVRAEQAEDLRAAVAAVQHARTLGLPIAGETSDRAVSGGTGAAALPAADERRAIEPPSARQIPLPIGRSPVRRGRRSRGRRTGRPAARGAALMAGRRLGLLSRKERTAPVPERLRALAEAAELCQDRVADGLVVEARRVVAQADRRLALSGDATVVALAGATGSGKSSLFNTLSGSDLATVGVRRPTTAHAMACVWGQDAGAELLDWLQIPRRHTRAPDPDGALDGLVLLDLPDHDSTERQHRVEVDRLVQLVDVLVWVVDPQKYADAALHDRYLKPLARHAEVMTVVLNQVDRLGPAEREQCLRDLRPTARLGRPGRGCGVGRLGRDRRGHRCVAAVGWPGASRTSRPPYAGCPRTSTWPAGLWPRRWASRRHRLSGRRVWTVWTRAWPRPRECRW